MIALHEENPLRSRIGNTTEDNILPTLNKLPTDEICDHAVSSENTEIDFIPVEPVAREQVHHRHFS